MPAARSGTTAQSSRPQNSPARKATSDLQRAADQELVNRAKQGDSEATGELYRRHHKGIIKACGGVVGRHEAEDALQDVMVTFPSRIRSFDPERGTFTSWIRRVVINQARRQITRQHQPACVDLWHVENFKPTSGDDPEDRVCGRETVLRCLHGLPLQQRRVVVRSAFLPLDDAAIASELGVTEVTVRVMRTKARKQLAKILRAA